MFYNNILTMLLYVVIFIIFFIFFYKYCKEEKTKKNKILSIATIKKPTIDIKTSNVKTWIQLDNYGMFGLYKANPDEFYIYDKSTKKMRNIINELPELISNYKTYAALSVDIDNNGLMDLIVARDDGVYLFINNTSLDGKLKFEKRLLLPSNDKDIPISIAITDYNKDGVLDIYVSNHTNPKYLTINPNYVSKNILLEGLGLGQFSIMDKFGHGDGNTEFLHLNGDNLVDLQTNKDIYFSDRGGSGGQFASAGFNFKKVNLKNATNSLKYDKYGLVIEQNGGGVEKDDDDENNKFKHMYLNKDKIMKNSLINNNNQELEQILQKSWSTLNGAIKNINDATFKEPNGWLNVSLERMDINKSDNNFIAVRLPSQSPFLDGLITVVSSKENDICGNRKYNVHKKQISYNSKNPYNSITFFNVGTDTQIDKLEVLSSIDGNFWKHPSPKINTITSFRNMQINP